MVKNDTKTFRSRILQYFSQEALEEIRKLIYNNRINDINTKVENLMSILDKYDIDYDELGTGTNRTAIFIDGYVFKIALDKWGVRDNEQEFTLSEELQPYVIKVYECNSIIMVCEYVVVISREEFAEHKPQIRSILSDLSNEYLLGDIGTINKNFANWGYRDNHELVALDFAYIYRVIGNEMFCDACDIHPMLEYTPDFDKLTCPHCRKQFQFMDIRRKISKEMETRELELSKERAYKITKERENVKLHDYDIINTNDNDTQGQTFKFNLGDYVTYKRRKEEYEMMKNRNNQDEERKLVPFINLDYDPEEEEVDDMLSEIEMLMMKKKGIIPQEEEMEEEKVFEDDEDDEIINDIIYRNATRQTIQRQDMTAYLDDEDEDFEEASADDMLEEIRNLRKHDEIIYIMGNDPEAKLEEETVEEDTEEEIQIEIVQEEISIEVKVEEEEDTEDEYSFNDMATEVAVEVAKELTPVEALLLEEEKARNEEKIAIEINTVEPAEIVETSQEVVFKAPEEEFQIPDNVESVLNISNEILTNLKDTLPEESNQALQQEIVKLICKHLSNHTDDLSSLNLNISVNIDTQKPEEDKQEDEVEVIVEEEETVSIEIQSPEFEIGGLVDHDKKHQDDVERMIELYGKDYDTVTTEETIIIDDYEDDDFEDVSEDELMELYKNY